MFTLEQNIIVQCYFRNDERSYSTPQVLEEFQQRVQKQAWHNSRINASNY
jgi:hypothetical protein